MKKTGVIFAYMFEINPQSSARYAACTVSERLDCQFLLKMLAGDEESCAKY